MDSAATESEAGSRGDKAAGCPAVVTKIDAGHELYNPPEAGALHGVERLVDVAFARLRRRRQVRRDHAAQAAPKELLGEPARVARTISTTREGGGWATRALPLPPVRQRVWIRRIVLDGDGGGVAERDRMDGMRTPNGGSLTTLDSYHKGPGKRVMALAAPGGGAYANGGGKRSRARAATFAPPPSETWPIQPQIAVALAALATTLAAAAFVQGVAGALAG